MRAVLAAGASRQQIDDALAVCFSFNAIGRLAMPSNSPCVAPMRSRLARNTSSRGYLRAHLVVEQRKWQFRRRMNPYFEKHKHESKKIQFLSMNKSFDVNTSKHH
jgi:hypothetical protein